MTSFDYLENARRIHFLFIISSIFYINRFQTEWSEIIIDYLRLSVFEKNDNFYEIR